MPPQLTGLLQNFSIFKILWLNIAFWKKGGGVEANFSLKELVGEAEPVKLYPQDVVQPTNSCLLGAPDRPTGAHYRGGPKEREQSSVWDGEQTTDLEQRLTGTRVKAGGSCYFRAPHQVPEHRDLCHIQISKVKWAQEIVGK